MNSSEFHILDTHIRNRISELEALVEQKSGSRAESQTVINPEALPDTELELKLAEKEKQELARLQSNLDWLASDQGGCCVQCGCDIPIPRLLAVPVTRLCVKCAS